MTEPTPPPAAGEAARRPVTEGRSGPATADTARARLEREPAARSSPRADTPGFELFPPLQNLASNRLISPFGMRGATRRHDGIDLRAAQGEKVLAAAAGRVVRSGVQRGYGNVVVLDHGDGLTTLYGHLFSRAVSKGNDVKAGDLIGLAGRRGNATTTHLHFEIRLDGIPVDPAPYLCLDSVPRKPS